MDISEFINKLPKAKKAKLDELIIIKELKKAENPLFSTPLNKTIVFVAKGTLRKYTIIEGIEKTTDLFFQNEVFFSPTLTYQPVAPYFLEAIQSSTVYIIRTDVFDKEKNKDVDFLQLEVSILELYNQQLQYRLETFQLLDARERYLDFIKRNSRAIQQVPLQYIASYLGINNASLSRIRAAIK